MHSFWNFFLERRQFTYLLMAALTAIGLIAVFAIPKESAPEVEVPVAIVTTTMRGASPADIALLVTKPIEKEVGAVSNIDKLTSTSREGVSVITAQFTADANLDKSIQDVKDAVDKAKPKLPRDADEPTVTRVNFADQPILIVALSGGLPPAEFAKLGDDLKDALELVSGVSRVEVSGTQKREVSVVVRRENLESYGLTISDVVAAISASNAATPVGSITVSNISYAIAFNGDLTDPNDMSAVVVGNRNGQPIYLSDVADIVNGVEKPTTISRVSVSGSPALPAITLSVFKKSGGNVVSTGDAVKATLSTLGPTLLKGITPTIVFDSSKQVRKDLTDLTTTGLETVILVMLTLLLTIGWRESVVAGLSIPLSFVIAFIGLYMSGNTINFVSLFSLILAIGILVDSGIVVTEAIHTRYKKFGNPLFAAQEAIREYAWPLTAGTLTTVAVFVPLFFLSGVTGKFVASIPFTVIFVLVASIFVALGMVPLIAILFTKRDMNRLEMMQEHWNNRAQTWYRGWLMGILRDKPFQKWFIRGMAIAFVLAMLLPISGIVKSIFFPGGDSDFIYLDIETKQGTPLTQADLATRAVEEELYHDPRIDSFVTTVGASSSFNQEGSTGSERYANITVNLVAKEKRTQTSTQILEEYRNKLMSFHDFTVRAYEEQGGPPSGAPVVVTFSGDNLDNLEQAANLSARVLAQVPGTTEITSSVKDNGTQFALTIDRAKAAQVGVTPAQIAAVLRTSVAGTVATTIHKDDQDIDVLVMLNLNPDWQEPWDASVAPLSSIENTSIETPRGAVLLGSLLSDSLEKSNAVITRKDQKNITTVSSYLTPGHTAGEASGAFAKLMSKETLPAGVTMQIGGETEDVQRSFREMGFALLGGMLLMMAILVLSFNSFRYTFYLLMLIPLSLVGVFVGLALMRQPLSFPSMLGVIALAGIIINHAIILMDSVIVRMKDPQTMTLEEVVVDAAASRLRPIVLTTLTTVIGMIPLAGVSALWGPLAFSIMFGLMFAMTLTLILTPILVYRHPDKQYWHATSENKEIGQ